MVSGQGEVPSRWVRSSRANRASAKWRRAFVRASAAGGKSRPHGAPRERRLFGADSAFNSVARPGVPAKNHRALSILSAAIHTTASPTSEGSRTESSKERRRAVSRKDRHRMPGASRGERTKGRSARRLIHFGCSCEKPTCLRAILAEPPAGAALPPALPTETQRRHRSETQPRRCPAMGG